MALESMKGADPREGISLKKQEHGGSEETTVTTNQGALTVPELMYFFFLPFFLGFKTCRLKEK